MRIVVNALSVYSGGGLVSLLELLPALREVDRNNDYIVVVADDQREILGGFPDGIHIHRVNVQYRKVVRRILFEQLVLPIVLWRLRADWLYSLGNQTVVLAPCKVCLLMENPNPYSKHTIAWSARERIRQRLLRILAKVSCWRATKVRFLTENSCTIMSAWIGIPKHKTCIIPHGVRVRELSDGHAPGNGKHFPEQFVLTASNIAPHKNIEVLMRAFDQFVRRNDYKGSLVIAGAFLYREYADTLMELRRILPSGERIIFLGWVDQKDLGFLYSRADLFVFPSIEETFGIPAIEAMAHGAPLLASMVKGNHADYFIPFEELCGSAAVYFDPFNPEDLASQMHRVNTNPELRANLIALGMTRAREYSWLRTARLLSEEFSLN